MQVFDFKDVNFNQAINMFEHMKVVKSSYEGVLELSYRKTTRNNPPMIAASGR